MQFLLILISGKFRFRASIYTDSVNPRIRLHASLSQRQTRVALEHPLPSTTPMYSHRRPTPALYPEDDHRREIERRARDRKSQAWDLVIKLLHDRGILGSHRTSQADVLILATDTMRSIYLLPCRPSKLIVFLTGLTLRPSSTPLEPLQNTHFIICSALNAQLAASREEIRRLNNMVLDIEQQLVGGYPAAHRGSSASSSLISTTKLQYRY